MLTSYRVHDFRVTCETRLADLGFNQDVRGAVLGHAKPGLQKTYNKHEYERAVRHIARLERLRLLSEQGVRPHYAFEAEELEHLRTLRDAIHAEMVAAGQVPG
ncbi:hypothetical protein ACFOKF_02780 [Sphingobium rhizovicinum]|uniref:Integrase n=1 Tax=Sphingobium rhizovicinum TaxID=432308 RepID=A0ABV7NA73_9SPHN